MTTEIVTAEWLHDQVFQLNDHLGFPIQMSQPDGVLGADLLPLSLIGCAIWDVANLLRKQRQAFSRLEIHAESEREADPPWRFLRIRLLYRIWGSGVNPIAVQRAIRLTEDKYCSTFATLKRAVEINTEFVIIDDQHSDGSKLSNSLIEP